MAGFQSRQVLRGWQKMERSSPYPPMSWEIALVVSDWLIRHGRWREGIAVIVSHHLYLRVGNTISLLKEDFVPGDDERMGEAQSFSMLILRKSKRGAYQCAKIRRPDVAALLRRLCDATADGERLFPFSADHLRTVLQTACQALGLGHLRFVWHSLRHGAASRDDLRNVPFHVIMARGRWQSEESCRRYCQPLRALMMLQSLPPGLVIRGRLFDADLLRMVFDALAVTRAL
jgi:hypothetical protein